MTLSNDLRSSFQRAIIIPILFFVGIAITTIYAITDIFSIENISRDMLLSKILIAFFIMFLAMLVLQIFSIRPILIKLQNSALNYKELANTDTLTGLMNRNALLHSYWLIQHNIERPSDVGHIIVLVDVDKFKSVNDTYGHACGDYALQHISTIIKHNIRTSDSCYRIGGEEFALLLPDTSIPSALLVLEKIRNLISVTPCNFGSNTINMTCTFGVSKINLAKPLEVNMAYADKALYKGKTSGRNKIFANDKPVK